VTAWFVASVDARPRSLGRKLHPNRTWCFFATKEEAVAHVTRSAFLLSENHYYSHAVIEAHEAGDLAIAKEEHWFRLDVGEHLPLGKRGPDYVEPVDAVVPCEKPDAFERVVNHTIG
jgi:hypothetical protein